MKWFKELLYQITFFINTNYIVIVEFVKTNRTLYFIAAAIKLPSRITLYGALMPAFKLKNLRVFRAAFDLPCFIVCYLIFVIYCLFVLLTAVSYFITMMVLQIYWVCCSLVAVAVRLFCLWKGRRKTGGCNKPAINWKCVP